MQEGDACESNTKEKILKVMIKLTALRASLTFPQKENLQNAESLRHFLLPRQASKLNLLTIQGPTENRYYYYYYYYYYYHYYYYYYYYY